MKVAWLIPQGEELNWSSALRLRRLDIAHWFKCARLASDTTVIRGYVGAEPVEDFAKKLLGYDAVIFAEQSEYDFYVMKALKAHQVRPLIVRDHCENIWDFPWEMECFREADLLVCSSKVLVEVAKIKGLMNVEYIPEHYDDCPVKILPPERLLAGYMGTDPWLAHEITKIANKAGWEVEILCRPEDGVPGSVTWKEDTWRDHFATYRVLLAPQRPEFKAKSPAKVVQGLGNGMPVLASAVPSYMDLIKHGENGFICTHDYVWYNAFKAMADDDIASALYSNLASSSIKDDYSISVIAGRWHTAIIKSLANHWRKL